MNQSNQTDDLSISALLFAVNVFLHVTYTNIIVSFILVPFGLASNLLIVYMFVQKRFRLNSSNVFLLCLGVNDGLFLVIHFFEVFIIFHFNRNFSFKTFEFE